MIDVDKFELLQKQLMLPRNGMNIKPKVPMPIKMDS